MPARWVELALRIHAVIDDADRDLDDRVRQLFIEQAYRIIIQRRKRRPTPTLRHPKPSSLSPPARDPTGDGDYPFAQK
jgi:hypothetical protein